MFYPVFLNLKNKRVVVIGGGEIAERKVESVLESGAVVTVVTPQATPRLEALAGENRIILHRRPYATGDCDGADLVLSATDQAELNRRVFQEAGAAGALVNTADQPDLCDFFMPAVVRRGPITIAISTAGASPGLAAQLRRKISDVVGPEYEQLAELLASVRSEVRARVPNESDRKALHYRILDSDILSYLKQNDMESAQRLLRELLES